MNPCQKSTHQNEIKTRASSVKEPEAGELSGRTVTPAEPEASRLPQAPDGQQQLNDAQKPTTSSTQPVDKPKNGRDSLREGFNKIDNPEHFDQFCSLVEEVYVQSRFHCTIDQLPADEMTQILLEHWDTLHDMATMTADLVAQDSTALGHKQQLAAGKNDQPASKPETSIHQRLHNLYPWYDDKCLYRLANYLNYDCQHVTGCQLSDLSDVELFKFIDRQITDRAKLHEDLTIKLLDKRFRLSEEDIFLLFSTYLPQPSKKRMSRKRPFIPERLYRLGTFTSNKDEMGRVKNCKLDQLSFDQKQVNFKHAAYGPGLYTSRSAAHSRGYRSQQYNLNKPLAILEMTTSKDTSLVDFKSTSGYTGQRSSSDCGNQPRTIIKTNPLEFLVKDPLCIINVNAFHPSMLTKVHIPFSQEEIEAHQLQHKMITEEDFALLDHVNTIQRRPIADTQGLESGIRDILECRVGVLPKWGSTRGLDKSKFHEIKFYAKSNVGPDLVRVKPAAPLNRYKKSKQAKTTCDQDVTVDYDFMEFHVQYHRLKRAGKSRGKTGNEPDSP